MQDLLDAFSANKVKRTSWRRIECMRFSWGIQPAMRLYMPGSAKSRLEIASTCYKLDLMLISGYGRKKEQSTCS